MNLLKSRVNRLIEHLSDRELESVWTILEKSYYDFYVLRGLQEAKEALQPGDSLTRKPLGSCALLDDEIP